MATSASCWRGCFNKIGMSLVYVMLCAALIFIGLIKGLFVGIAAAMVIFVGHISVTVILWPLHVYMTYNTIARTKKLGLVLKLLSLLLLPVPLFLWPVLVAVGSVLVGLGYGFGTPLVATFEAVGENRESKFYHAFVDGTVSTLTGSCTVVRDFTDLCVHSYCDYLDDFRSSEPKDGKPLDVKLLELPACLAVAVLGLIADTPLITLVAVVKSPFLLFKGWSRLLHDLLGRHGACLEAACVPFAGLALLLWPAVVVASVLLAIVSSPLLGLFGAVIVYQEDSLRCGLAYVVSIVAMFDEYTNDLLNLNEGSCLPRPRYRKDLSKPDPMPPGTYISPLSPDNAIFSPTAVPQMTSSRSLRQQLQEVKLVQIWEDTFRNINLRGKYLVEAGVLNTADLDGWLRGGKSPKWKIVACGLPAYCTLHTLLESAKSNSAGILLSDGTELTAANKPQERMLDWFFEPLLTLKEQLRFANLTEVEEHYLEKLVLTEGDPVRMLDWENGGVEPVNDIRRGELQALSRRLQGIATAISRLPTYRRHYKRFIKGLLLYALDRINTDSSSSATEESLRFDPTPESSVPGSPENIPVENNIV
ncbi:uncharacterized membrane protein At3g27390 [Physcomitrium patens]|uniref:Transmembrane protein n=1 Tax=Physcomitrium patens TaxID=3218 RepID=A0A2K1KGP1_PHYPA|nr:uncharacterized membrane protein At3g27390-like [Physcomitrium patens]XP_024379390.1 uncharacterized membrane protein At3g27390-like [Physcomitrium patens]XP_024379391.1 uncharacterized membrane protein At3g27390-like [Physcomitrium patens]XP_024379392.1 uncharacterized membrane protein At3g27390-like [Physcomitrium patens]XP_024379393.1 uncharacterized membrane protein At3g27390-like [Physcomitrium patens]XP_024379394.1 uncharacterized membrane protein At3g27390-like [Physcomitrium patens]|eukprot:XP_024379389.1 uncharacterized membrane protein At3g27390-like [Physcomitrella patens]